MTPFLTLSRDPLGSRLSHHSGKNCLGVWRLDRAAAFMQGTQSRLNFLPEKHTDFIFTTLSEEFGFVGSIPCWVYTILVVVFCITSAFGNKDRFRITLTLGIGITFFLFFAVNIAMVIGLAPVVGVPLPLVSYGGSAMLNLLLGFGLMQSAHVHRPRPK